MQNLKIKEYPEVKSIISEKPRDIKLNKSSQSDFSLIELKIFIQCDYPTFNYYFKELNGKQQLIISKNYIETCCIYIENNTIHFKKYHSIVLPHLNKLSNIISFLSKPLLFRQNEEKYDSFIKAIFQVILSNYPDSFFDVKNGTISVSAR